MNEIYDTPLGICVVLPVLLFLGVWVGGVLIIIALKGLAAYGMMIGALLESGNPIVWCMVIVLVVIFLINPLVGLIIVSIPWGLITLGFLFAR
jgi:hypothetical protein